MRFRLSSPSACTWTRLSGCGWELRCVLSSPFPLPRSPSLAQHTHTPSFPPVGPCFCAGSANENKHTCRHNSTLASPETPEGRGVAGEGADLENLRTSASSCFLALTSVSWASRARPLQGGREATVLGTGNAVPPETFQPSPLTLPPIPRGQLPGTAPGPEACLHPGTPRPITNGL